MIISALPEGLSAENVEILQLATDRFTSVPDSSVSFWADKSGQISMAFVRGSLPTEPWTGATERVDVGGIQAALGPLSDGVWQWLSSNQSHLAIRARSCSIPRLAQMRRDKSLSRSETVRR